jgi:hypothetical protein
MEISSFCVDILAGGLELFFGIAQPKDQVGNIAQVAIRQHEVVIKNTTGFKPQGLKRFDDMVLVADNLSFQQG